MRVITGTAKGKKLKAPAGMNTRPTTDRVKEALFSILGNRVLGARVLDLFAGSGALTIEALSRGAANGVLVDSSGPAAAVIKENLLQTRLSEQAEIIRKDVFKVLRDLGARGCEFDLIFLDPPYGKDLARQCLTMLGELALLAADGTIIAETAKQDDLGSDPFGLTLIKSARYGDTMLYLFGRQGE